MAIMKRAYGNTGRYNNLFKKWIKYPPVPEVKTAEPEEEIDEVEQNYLCKKCALNENCPGYYTGCFQAVNVQPLNNIQAAKIDGTRMGTIYLKGGDKRCFRYI